jgi:hypothetical protein
MGTRLRRRVARYCIALILEDLREDGLRCIPQDAERETITVTIHGAVALQTSCR